MEKLVDPRGELAAVDCANPPTRYDTVFVNQERDWNAHDAVVDRDAAILIGSVWIGYVELAEKPLRWFAVILDVRADEEDAPVLVRSPRGFQINGLGAARRARG